MICIDSNATNIIIIIIKSDSKYIYNKILKDFFHMNDALLNFPFNQES